MTDVKTLETLCHKLGLPTNLTAKARELSELLEVRAGISSLSALRLTGSCRWVICLDLAAQKAGHSLNKQDVIRLSSMPKKSYTEAVRVVANLLGLEEKITLQELAIQFGCTGALSLASDILTRYSKAQFTGVDCYAPMFLCAALVVAAKTQKIRIDSAKLRDRTGTKKSSFDRLVTQFQSYAVLPEEKKSSASSKRRKGLIDTIEAQIEEEERNLKRSRLNEEEENSQENGSISTSEYEEWKKKILAKAAKSS